MTMMESVRGKLDARCLRKQCRAGKCSISLKGVSRQFVLIHMDSPGSPPSQHETRCDYLYIGYLDDMGRSPWTVPIELKSGGISASEVAKQLQAGADVADLIIPHNASTKFTPVVASGRLSKIEQRRLRNTSNKVRFRGKSEIVQRIRCGDPLTRVLTDTI